MKDLKRQFSPVLTLGLTKLCFIDVSPSLVVRMWRPRERFGVLEVRFGRQAVCALASQSPAGLRTCATAWVEIFQVGRWKACLGTGAWQLFCAFLRSALAVTTSLTLFRHDGGQVRFGLFLFGG